MEGGFWKVDVEPEKRGGSNTFVGNQFEESVGEALPGQKERTQGFLQNVKHQRR